MCTTLTTSKCCVVPVAADDALAWAAGNLTDAELLTRSPLVPEAVFIVDLPDRATYRQMLRQVKYWREKGAVLLIARTGTPIVLKHLVVKNGATMTWRENTEPVKFRFVAPPAIFAAWCQKLGALRSRPPVNRRTTATLGAFATAK